MVGERWPLGLEALHLRGEPLSALYAGRLGEARVKTRLLFGVYD
jgi:hypothetical protein